MCSSDLRAEIIGGIRIGSAARIDIVGTCSVIGCNASGSGGVSINGFGMSMSVTVKNLGTPLILVEAVGTLRIAGANMSLSAMIQPQTGSFSFTGSSNFPSGSILRKFDIELAHIFNPPRYVNGTLLYVPPTLRAAFRASGSLGGRFRSVSGTTADFTTGWVDFTPDISELRLVASPNLDLGLITVPVTLGFIVCLTGDCAGRITPKFSISSSFKGIPFNIPDTDLGNDWGFAASTSAYFSGSDKVGSRWGGLKGSFEGDVSLGISSASGLDVSSSVRVKAYVGAGGSWNYLGTYGADIDFSGAGFRFCKRLSGRTICIP